jgi:hypothetical protein
MSPLPHAPSPSTRKKNKKYLHKKYKIYSQYTRDIQEPEQNPELKFIDRFRYDKSVKTGC